MSAKAETLTKDAENASAPVPRDVRLISLILASMGIEDADPAVLVQLLEFAHRYTAQVLQDALVYADHASSRQGGSSVSIDDVQLAIQSRVNYSFTQPPSKEMLLSLATSLNSVPLPPVSNRYGIRLPPPEHCLTNVNFSIVPDPPSKPEFGNSILQPPVTKPVADAGVHNNAQAADDDDTSMVDVDEDATRKDGSASGGGVKRALEEDEDYD